MVVTVEPGCYFNPFLLEPAFEDSTQSPFLNRRRLQGSMVSQHTHCELSCSCTSTAMLYIYIYIYVNCSVTCKL